MIRRSDRRLEPLTPEQIRQYEEDGYLLVRGAVSQDLIHAYNEHIYTIRSQDPMPEWVMPNKFGKGKIEEKDRYSLRLFHPHKHDGFSLQMMKLPVVRGALAQLLGMEAVGIQSMYFFKEPGSPGQAAHQDFYYIRCEPHTLTAAWIAMEDIDTENGCLWVIPGSHKLGLLPHGAVKNLKEHEEWTHESEGIDLTKEIPVEMKSGDILFFNDLIVHSSNRNRSKDRWRRSYVCHYVSSETIVEREDILPRYTLV